jgi:hypothetical protein
MNAFPNRVWERVIKYYIRDDEMNGGQTKRRLPTLPDLDCRNYSDVGWVGTKWKPTIPLENGAVSLLPTLLALGESRNPIFGKNRISKLV